MRLSELITIYLAAAAPVGVAYFLRQHHMHVERTPRLLRSACAALLWPLALCAHLFTERRSARAADVQPDTRLNGPRITAAERALVNTLHETDDLLRDAYDARGERARQAATDARTGIERFVGLTLALAATTPDERPTERELELCRVAGRKGDDLLLAGRCVHRRNLARLRAHHEQARTALIHTCAELLETIEHDLPPRPVGAPAFTRLYWLLIRAFAQTIDLLSLLDDQEAVTRVARLLDAACAWARRHDVLNVPSAAATQFGGVPCPPQSQPANLTHPTQQPAL
ncbi:MAG TPA: hypothetical protein VF525_18825 [Pyrinomonadaceae bacterium]|jgi:hypothetical protein